MPTGATIKQMRRLQIEEESVFGTTLPAVRLLRVNNVTWNDPGRFRKYNPAYDVGRMTLRTDVGTVIAKGWTGVVEADLSFEDFLWPMLCGFKGGVTGVEQNPSEGDYLYTFKNDPNTPDVLPDSYCAEARWDDGTTQYDREVGAILIESFEISAAMGGDVTKITINCFGRTPVDEGSFAVLSLPTPFNTIPVLDWKLYIDNTWGGLGGTNIASQMRSFTLRYVTGLTEKLMLGDGRLDMVTYQPGPRGFQLSAEFETAGAMLHTSTGERKKFEDAAKRYVRLIAEGDQIGVGDKQAIQFDMALDYQDGGFGELGRNAEGVDIVSINLESIADDDTNDSEVLVTNELTSFPD